MRKEGMTLKLFKRIHMDGSDYTLDKPDFKRFILPQDYQKALEYAKEAINSPFWNTPVKPSSKDVPVGKAPFLVKFKNGEIYHNSSNITSWVKSVINYYCNNKLFGEYSLDIEDITFSRTGCQSHKTKLSDWKEVWKQYEEWSGKRNDGSIEKPNLPF